MDIAEAETVRFYACERKQVFPDHGTAHRSRPARRGATPYKCPFCSGVHVGRTPSMTTLKRVAAAVRALAQQEVPQ